MDTLGTEEILWENEVRANLQVARVLLICSTIMVLSLLLDLVGVYKIKIAVMAQLTALYLLLLMVPYITCRLCKGKKRFLKLFMLTGLVLGCAAADFVLGYNVVLAMTVPVVLSSRYYNRKLTIFVAIISSVAFALSSAFGYMYGVIDMNHVPLEPGTVLVIEKNLSSAVAEVGFSLQKYQGKMILQNFMPKYTLFLAIAVVSAEIAYRGHEMVIRQNTVAREHARIDTELEMARQIQEHALPIVHDLEEHPSFDLAASMAPAKEIGGDFYDFIRLDDTHLALVIADVSGKGIPAAMYMMVSKLLLDNALQGRRSPGAVLTEVNHQLCEKNLDNMFVTVWLGIVDLTSGKIISANGGHERPLICRKSGKFEAVKDKHGLVLGAMDGIRYKETDLTLEPGDTLFVYTDGVTEANNEAGVLYGLDNARVALDEAKSSNMQELLASFRESLDLFVGKAPQFDDITMMGFRMNGYVSEKGKTLSPNEASITDMQAYMESVMKDADLPSKLQTKMNIAIDEIYSNIVRYSGASWANGYCEITEQAVTVTFRDNGIPYDPLIQADPDIGQSLAQREIGGLGLFMTRKLMDDFAYEYKDGVNINRLTLHK